MSANTPDRRTLRTKKLLRQALLDLIREKGLEAITVSDLTSRAEVNRGTFYLHYRDVGDLLSQLQEDSYKGLEKVASKMDIERLIESAERDAPYPALVEILEYWKQNADFLQIMFGPRGDPAFVLRLKNLMIDMIYSKLPHILPAGTEPPIPLDYLIAYMASANVGVVQHWFQTGIKESPQEIARIMTKLVNYGPLGSIGIRRLS